MILTDESIYARAVMSGEWPKRYLAMCVAEPIANKISGMLRLDQSAAFYFVASLFDDYERCGDSGIHEYVRGIDLTPAIPFAGFPTKMAPIRVWIMISAEEIDDLRLRRKQWNGWQERFQNPHPFPEYTRLEG